MTLKSGTIISCPDCSRALLRTTKDLLPGSQMIDAQFESLGFDMTAMRPGCQDCGARFIREHPITKKTQIHTEDRHWVTLSKEKPCT